MGGCGSPGGAGGRGRRGFGGLGGGFGTETEKPNDVTKSLAGSVGVGVGGVPRGGGGTAAALRVVVVLILIILVLVILVVLGRWGGEGMAERTGGLAAGLGALAAVHHLPLVPCSPSPLWHGVGGVSPQKGGLQPHPSHRCHPRVEGDGGGTWGRSEFARAQLGSCQGGERAGAARGGPTLTSATASLHDPR